MPDVFANDYLDRIMKKTEKSLNWLFSDTLLSYK
jgi:hypothetical protein